MTSTRARERTLVYAMLAIIFTIGALANCGSPESQQKALERYGYSNVQNLKDQGRPSSYLATLNNCTIDLSKTADKEIWVAVITKTPKGDMVDIPHTPGENAFEYAHNTEALRKDPRFIKFCP